jgi:D-tyrosyl-tRNA(Tyr) deacylase
MRAVVQRVSEASVQVENQKVGSIGHGILVLLGVGQDDGPGDAVYMAEKVVNLRIFADEQGKMNRSLLDVEHAGSLGVTVATGQFQEMMEVSLVNDGPVTLLLDSKKEF